VMLTLRCGAGGNGIEELAQDCLSRLPGVVTVAIEPETKGGAAACAPSAEQAEGGARTAEPRVLGKPRLTYHVGAFQYQISPGSFFQASRFLLPEFAKAVTAGDERAGTALDLYAGVGLFTLPLARRFSQVVAVEANRRAAADLAHNAGAHGLANVRAVAAPAAEFLRRYAQSPELVVLDPPRAGAEMRTLHRLAEIDPGRIHYASCDAPTLARDLAYLLRHGYRLDSLELFDFYPQTFHIETLAKLSRARSVAFNGAKPV